jgi:hypothetical protein
LSFFAAFDNSSIFFAVQQEDRKSNTHNTHKRKKNSVAKVLVAVGQTSRRLVNDKIPFLL